VPQAYRSRGAARAAAQWHRSPDTITQPGRPGAEAPGELGAGTGAELGGHAGQVCRGVNMQRLNSLSFMADHSKSETYRTGHRDPDSRKGRP
jgi:hypothetical protein